MKCFSVLDADASGGSGGGGGGGMTGNRSRSHRNNNGGGPSGIPSAIVGRDAQLDMANMVLSSRPSMPTLMYFSGPKGLGKTTMLHRVTQSAKALNYKVAQAFPNLAPESGDALAYATVRSWLRQLFELDAGLCMQTYDNCTLGQREMLRRLQQQTSENPLPKVFAEAMKTCLLYTSPSPRDRG